MDMIFTPIQLINSERVPPL